jgi:hypothetical protein
MGMARRAYGRIVVADDSGPGDLEAGVATRPPTAQDPHSWRVDPAGRAWHERW